MHDTKLIMDPIIQKFVDDLAQQDGAPLYTLSPEQARKVLDDVQAISVPLAPATIEDMIIPIGSTGSVGIRIIKSKNAAGILPVIIYMHGGGWVLGNTETHDRLVREIVHGAQAAVIFVNYTLAPEGHYPTAHEQGYAVAQWIYERGKTLNLDSSRMAIAGDSVGGLMATAIALMAQERGGPQFLMQLLFYPVTDAHFDTTSYNQFAQGPWLTKAAMMWFWDNYVPDKKMRAQPFISPLQASLDQLKSSPPTFITVNEYDVLRDEGEAYAHKLMQAGVPVVALRCLGMIHDCLMLNPITKAPLVRTIITQANQLLKEALAKRTD